MLLYPVYALLFADAGLSVGEISLLFGIWSVTGFVLEVPSGVLADAVSRRVLLVVAPLAAGAGFGLWVLVPSFWAFAAGFVLWGIHGALVSGAQEALVYDALDERGEADRYATVMGRASAAQTVGVALGTGLAAPALAVGGFGWLGVASVATCVAAALVATGLPDPAREPEWSTSHSPGGDDVAHPGASIVRAALAEVRRSPRLRHALLLVPLVTAVWGSLDEYLPLLARGTGAELAAVPLLILVVSAGSVAGGALAGRLEAAGVRALALVLLVAAATLAAGALLRSPAGFVALAVAFGAFQAATVTADARLQHAMDGGARSTVTSVASLLTEVAVLATFALYGLGSIVLDDAGLFALLALAYLPAAAWAVHERDR